MQSKSWRPATLAALIAAGIGCATPEERLPAPPPGPGCSKASECGYAGGVPAAGGGGPAGGGSGDAGVSSVADITGEVGVAITAELDQVERFGGVARVSAPGPKGAIIEALYDPGASGIFTLTGVLTGDQWLFVQDDTAGGAGIFSTFSLHRIPSPVPLFVTALDRTVIETIAQLDPSAPLIDPARAQILLALTHAGQPAAGVSVRSGGAGALVVYDQGAGIYSSLAEATGSAGVIGLINASTPSGGGTLSIRLADATGELFEVALPAAPGAATIAPFEL
jgi:hypothetical protein